jgi:beta-phosphoglucomutase-like phosphatase (HAD superfamily)
VIFDCDGVLVDSEPIANRVFSRMLGELGLPMDYDETVRTFVGRSVATCVRMVEDRIGRPVPEGWVDAWRQRTFDAFSGELRPVEGVAEALDRIGVPFCVASSGEPAKMRFTLGMTVFGYAAMTAPDALRAAGAAHVFTYMDALPELLARAGRVNRAGAALPPAGAR